MENEQTAFEEWMKSIGYPNPKAVKWDYDFLKEAWEAGVAHGRTLLPTSFQGEKIEWDDMAGVYVPSKD